MKIGEFAKRCNTQISVLRHYDKLKLLSPVHIDNFTGYRYYSESQIAVFSRIRDLKEAGFTLSEIKTILYSHDSENVRLIIDRKQAQLLKTLQRLEALRQNLSGGIVMEQKYEPFIEDLDQPFVNDEQVIGRWSVLPDDSGINPSDIQIGNRTHELYFLPDGESYWCYGWTKGKLFYLDGVNSFANDYQLEQRDDGLYMTVFFKSFDFPETGEITEIMLKKLDSGRYSAADIARKDDIDRPFIADRRVLGRWISVDYLRDKSEKKDYRPDHKYSTFKLFFKEVEFFENGLCKSVYDDQVISGEKVQTWTKGFVLRKWNSTACAYEIQQHGDTEYLIMEWKSGDYRWGNMETDYYVFVRA